MSEEQKPRQVRMVDDPNRHHGVRIIPEGESVTDLSVEAAEKWSEADVRITKTIHDVRGSTAQSLRLTDAEAQELFGKLATYLLEKGFLRVGKPEETEHPCGDYPAPCNHDPACEDPR